MIQGVLAFVNIATTAMQLLGPKGPSTMDLMEIQTDMLRKISAQISLIQQNTELILEQLGELNRLINELPKETAYEICKKKLEGLLGSYNEIIDGFIREREKIGINSAHTVYDNLIEEELLRPLRETRNILFTDENPIDLPLVALCLQAEVHLSILCNNSHSKIIAALKRYSEWVKLLQDETRNNSIPNRMTKLRDLMNKNISLISNYDNKFLCLDSKHLGSFAGIQYSRLGSAMFHLKNSSFKLVNVLSNDDNQNIQTLISEGMLTEIDLPKRVEFKQYELIEKITVWYKFIPTDGTANCYSSNPRIIPENYEQIESRIHNTNQCRDNKVKIEDLPDVYKISQNLELYGLSMIAIGSLNLVGCQILHSVEKFLNELNSINN